MWYKHTLDVHASQTSRLQLKGRIPVLWLGVASGFLRCLACSLFCRAMSSQFSFCLVPPFLEPAYIDITLPCSHAQAGCLYVQYRLSTASCREACMTSACQMPY